jgi:group II intron reverse transcriptase/maturase
MRTAETVLNIIRDRGQQGRPLERLYRHLYNRELYLCAYGKLYRNKGAMTPGATPETVDGMSLEKIDAIIEALRQERYRWTPVRREYIPKKNKKLRALGLPTWSDKLLQEVIRLILEAYYEPMFSQHSHGFRPGRGCHTALQEIQQWDGTKWFIEGDIRACFDTINFTILVDILGEQIHDNRFLRLIENFLKAGYMEDWKYINSYSGVPQGGVLSPCLSNLVLDKLDKFVEQTLIPSYTQGQRRKTYPPYVALTKKAWSARQAGDWESAQRFSQQAQTLPSRDPNDPNFRRLKYCRYADDFILGFTGPRAEAQVIKQQLTRFLQEELKLELSTEKSLITHARNDYACFLGYEIHALHANDKHDHRGQRCINGSIGLRVPKRVIHDHYLKYMRRGKPYHLMQRTNDSVYSIIAQYQTEYLGVVQYYRMAYNLHQLGRLKWVMQQSLVRTLSRKLKISTAQVYKRFKSTYRNKHGTYKVLEAKLERGAGQPPLTARFGGIPLQYNRWATINDTPTTPIWSKRSELAERLQAQECELCGATNNIEVHHIRKLADLEQHGQTNPSQWVKQMAARRRKTLVVCRSCHHDIQYGRYDGPKLSK